MAHGEQLRFIQTVVQHFNTDVRNSHVLEIGSYDVNGSVRQFFEGSHYCGTDLMEGPGVDVVADGHLLNHQDESYDITLSCECFEHNPHWSSTFLNMHRMTRPGGFVIFTCATRGRLEHGTQRTSPAESPGSQDIGWNYYKNLQAKDFTKQFPIGELFSQHLFVTNRRSKDLYFIGSKKGETPIYEFDADRLRQENRSAQREFARLKFHRKALYKKLTSPLSWLSKTPLELAAFLPDEKFQNFALSYRRLLKFR